MWIQAYLHVREAEHLNTNMRIHLKHFIKFAHLEQHGAVKVSGLELPPEQAHACLSQPHVTRKPVNAAILQASLERSPKIYIELHSSPLLLSLRDLIGLEPVVWNV